MTQTISINRLYDDPVFEIIPTPMKRSWMDNTPGKFAYHCVPLNVANTHGWSVICPEDFTISWNGMQDLDAIQVNGGSGSTWVSSHFGSGIFTIGVDFVIRTDPGVSLYVRGTPNTPYQYIVPLDGIIETDWLPFTFTFNYMFTEPCLLQFKKGTPLFSFFPIERSFIKEFEINETSITSDEDFYSKYQEYAASRGDHNYQGKDERQKFYLNGTDADGVKYDISDHTKRYDLKKRS